MILGKFWNCRMSGTRHLSERNTFMLVGGITIGENIV